MKNLTLTNESVVLCGRKLKWNGEIHSSYTRNGIINIKKNHTFECTESTSYQFFI